MSRLTEKPTPPESYECCGGGSCAPCVWDRYYDQLREWQAQQGESVQEVRSATSSQRETQVYR